MESDRDNAVIVRTIIDLGHNLGLKVVAEGVETRKGVEMLQSFQCNEAQGFYFCPPVTGQRISEFSGDERFVLGPSGSQKWDVSRNGPAQVSRTTPLPKLVNVQDQRYQLSAEIAAEDDGQFALKIR
jgi:predicted signal transduction protein with EAL and GGDEF domain